MGQRSQIILLNRTFALYKVKGNEIALKEAMKIKLDKSPLYHSLLAELYVDLNLKKQIEHLEIAITLTNNDNDKHVLESKLILYRREKE